MSHRRIVLVATLALATAVGMQAGTAAATTVAGLTDAELEQVLAKGKITRKEDIGSGVTRPRRLWLELDGVTLSASYKDVDYDKRGVTRLSRGSTELNFTDSYEYERAAYLLDRAIGLEMVPVTVVRRLRRDPGAVTLWIDNSLTEAERLAQSLRPPDLAQFIHQQADMRIFDALIYNTDRHANNQLITLADWRLHLIDHSRAFRILEELPEGYVANPVSISRRLMTALAALNEPELKQLLKRELSPRQIQSLLKRRDLILEKLERDRLEYGDSFAFREEKRAH